MSTPTITVAHFSAHRGKPLLILGPSLGTSVTALWRDTAAVLADDFDVVGWDLPGHGTNPAIGRDSFTMAELTEGVLSVIDDLQEIRRDDRPFHYAGVSTGGSVGLQLTLDHPERLHAAALICTGARIGTNDGWRDRAELVRSSGIHAVVTTSPGRWFAPDFVDSKPEITERLVASLRATAPEGYARTCGALATFDVRDRLHEVRTPLLTIAGAEDAATPPSSLEAIARAATGPATSIVLAHAAHLAPAEAPHLVAEALARFFAIDHQSHVVTAP